MEGLNTERDNVPVEVDTPDMDSCPDATVVIANDPDDVDAPEAVRLTVPAGIMEAARLPVDVDNALPVSSSGDTDVMDNEPVDVDAPDAVNWTGPAIDNAREPVEVLAPEAARGNPGLTDSIWNVPGNASAPEYPEKKYNPTTLRLNPNPARDAVCWMKYAPTPVAEVSQ